MKQRLMLVLKVLRKQLTFVICGVVVIAAIVLAYWPTGGWFSDLEAQLDQSISVNQQINTLMGQQRHLPSVSIDSAAQPATLDFFPTDDVIKKGAAAVTEVGTRSKQMLDTAVKINIHVPLVAAALPNGSDIDRSQFANAYLAAMTGDARIRNWPAPELQTVRAIPALLAGKPVSLAEIAAKTEELKKEIDKNIIVYVNGQPTADSSASATAELVIESKTLPQQLELKEAKAIKVYLQDGAIKAPLAYAEFQKATSSLPASEIWTAQLHLWTVEDVATGVAYANADAHDVTDSPVKQIVDVEVKDPPYAISGDPTAGKEDQPITPVPDATPTGRVSNGMYDVVQFKVSLDVDANRIADVLDAMQEKQFITILAVQLQAADTADIVNKGLIYGKAPIVRMDLGCEELLLHNWTQALQPPDGGAAKYVTPGSSGSSQISTIFPTTGNPGVSSSVGGGGGVGTPGGNF